jgi:hypothetical protein
VRTTIAAQACSCLSRHFDARLISVRNLELPYLNLGHRLEQQGKVLETTELYERAIARGLNSALFSHHLVAASGQVTHRAPDRWVSATFDNFAASFDARLRSLGYNAPQLLAAMLRSHANEALYVLDLGCGIGQCELSLTQQKRCLVRVDLSEKMLAQARAHGIYDELHLDRGMRITQLHPAADWPLCTGGNIHQATCGTGVRGRYRRSHGYPHGFGQSACRSTISAAKKVTGPARAVIAPRQAIQAKLVELRPVPS